MNRQGELLGDREVTCVRGEQRERCTVSWWRAGEQRYGVAVAGSFGRHEAVAGDAFAALEQVRGELERHGWLLAVQGARADAYPSGMARDMGGGLRVYLMRRGQPATELVDTFADADPGAVASVAEQRAYVEEWRRSLRD